MPSAASALRLRAPPAAAAASLFFQLLLLRFLFLFFFPLPTSLPLPPTRHPSQRAEMSGDAINKKKIVTFALRLIGGSGEREKRRRGFSAAGEPALARGGRGSRAAWGRALPRVPQARQAGHGRRASSRPGALGGARRPLPSPAARRRQADRPRRPGSLLQGARRLLVAAGGEFVQTFWSCGRGGSRELRGS